MIGRIKGTLVSKQTQLVTVDVNGIGYEINVPMNTLFQLPEVGCEVVLNTHFVVREDAQLLYGFYELKERSLFRILIKINGVGPKMGLAILSGMSANELASCVHNNDLKAMVRLPGVGKKTAERLIIELRDKLKDWELDYGNTLNDPQTATGSTQSSTIQDAESALISLGYKPQDASKGVAAAARQLEQNDQAIESETLIRLALKGMV